MKTLNDNPSTGNPLPTDKEFYEKDFNTTLEAEVFDNGPETEDERLGDRAVKGAAWLGAIVGLFALAILICAAFNLNPTPSPSKPQPVKTALQKAFISSPSENNAATYIGYDGKYANSFAKYNTQPIVLKSITIIAQEPTNVTAANVKAPAPEVTSVESQAPSMSKAYQDRIEKEALEVIHGDYGNNPGRAAKLGADYSAVQARVNQLLHS